MPCDSISTVEVAAGKMDAQHVKRALEAMGLHPRHDRAQVYTHDAGQYNHVTGAAQWYGQDRTAELKQAYSAEVVKSQAAKYRWTLKQNPSNRYAFTVAKR